MLDLLQEGKDAWPIWTACDSTKREPFFAGMNLAPLPIEGSEVGFWAATFGAIGAGLVVLLAFLGYAYWKKILLIPSK